MMNPRIIFLVFAISAAAAAKGADEALPKNATGEFVLTFARATVGKPVPTWAEGAVTFRPPVGLGAAIGK